MVTINSWDWMSGPRWHQFFAYANAYIEGASLMCAGMRDQAERQTWPHTQVVCLLGAHAAELFLKGALLSLDYDVALAAWAASQGTAPRPSSAGIAVRSGHCLRRFADEYNAMCRSQGQSHYFACPFITDLDDAIPNEQRSSLLAKDHRMVASIAFRYPEGQHVSFDAFGAVEKTSAPWDSSGTWTLAGLSVVVNTLRDDFDRLMPLFGYSRPV